MIKKIRYNEVKLCLLQYTRKTLQQNTVKIFGNFDVPRFVLRYAVNGVDGDSFQVFYFISLYRICTCASTLKTYITERN